MRKSKRVKAAKVVEEKLVRTKKSNFDYSKALQKHGVKEKKKLLNEILTFVRALKKAL